MSIMASEFARLETLATKISTDTVTTTTTPWGTATGHSSLATSTTLFNGTSLFSNANEAITSTTMSPDAPSTPLKATIVVAATATRPEITDGMASPMTSTHIAEHTTSRIVASSNAVQSGIANANVGWYAGLIGVVLAEVAVF